MIPLWNWPKAFEFCIGFLLLVLHVRVRNVDLIWLLQPSSQVLLIIRDWLHQRPNKNKNNSIEEKHLAQWDGRAENRHQCSDILKGWMGETGFSWMLQA